MRIKSWEEYLRVYTRWIIHNSPLVLFLYVPLFAGAVYATYSHLGINTDLSDMISDRLEFHRHWVDYKEEFPDLNDTFLVVVESDERVSSREFVRELRERVREHSEMFEHSAWLNDPELFGPQSFPLASSAEQEQLEKLFEEYAPLSREFARAPNVSGMMQMTSSLQSLDEADSLLAQISEIDQGTRQKLSYSEIFAEDFLEDDREFFEVKGVMNYNEVLPAEQSLLTLKSIIAEIKPDSVRVGVTGPAALGFEELKSVSDGMALSALLSLVMVALILALALKSIRLISLTLVNLIVGLVLTAAFAALTVGHLNMISVAFAVLFIGLGVDYSIHVLLRYRELKASKAKDAAIEEAVVKIGSSLVLCSVTTAIGFFAFVPTHYAGVSELGIISGSGMFINLFVHMSLMPALIKVLPDHKFRSTHVWNPGAWLAEQSFYRAKWSLGVGLGLVILAGLTLPNSHFDSNPLNLQNPDTEAYQVYRDLLRTSESSPWTIKILEPDEAKLKDLKSKLLALDEVSHVVAIDDFRPKASRSFDLSLPPLNVSQKETTNSEFSRNQRFFKKQWGEKYPILANADEAFWKDKMLEPTIDFYADLRSLQSGEVLRMGDMESRYQSETGMNRIEVFPKYDLMDIDKMREFAAKVLEVSPQATDDPVTLPLSGDAVVEAFIQATLTALVLVFLILLLITRSWQDSLIVSAPLFVSGVVTLGFVNLLGLNFNFANIIVVPLLLGIGVDSGIHLVHRFRTSSLKESLRGTSSQAIFYSSFTTIFSFGTLYLSPHRGTASMGLLLTIGTIIVMISTLVVIPACMKLALGKQGSEETQRSQEKRLAS